MHSLLSIWRRIIFNGIDASFDERKRKATVLLNIFWFSSLVGYQLFFLLIFLGTKGSHTILIISHLVMTIVFAIVGLLIGYQKKAAAKILLMTVINLGIFFYDNYTGTGLAISAYYITFLFVSLNIFSFRFNRWLLLLYAFIPIALFITTGIITGSITSVVIADSMVVFLRTFNFSFSFLMVAIYGVYVVNFNSINEDDLEQSTINLQTLIDNTKGSIWSINTKYEIIAANEVYKQDMKKIFGIDVHPGFSMLDVINNPDYPSQWQNQYRRVFSGESFNEEYPFENDVFELLATPIHNITGEVIGAAFYARNITFRKKAEQELITARKKAEAGTQAKAQFLSNMSHELRTPLNGIIGITNILLSEQRLPAEQQHLEMLKYSSDHMLDVINNILDYNKIEAGKVELEKISFNLSKEINNLGSFFIHEALKKNLAFEVILPDMINREVIGDVVRLRQVLTNLLSNAIKFTENGFVKLEVETVEKISDNACVLRFSVADSGIGIERSKMKKIFDSFTQADVRTTRRYGGTGLGLTISGKLIELMGGELKVESIHGKSSRFWFDLTFECSKEGMQQPENKKATLTDLKGCHILIAEDNAINMIVAKKMLERWNAKVTEAENGAIAVKYAEQQQFDIILMDIEMPVMDGLSAVAKIRSFNTAVPIIALSANAAEDKQGDLRINGLNEYIQKPFLPEELHGKISKLIKLH
jgi:signal transduction histidine kinase